MSFTKTDYLDWRSDPVTEGFQDEVQDKIDILIASLVNFAGDNQVKDARLSGEIKGLKELFDWVPVVEDEPTEENTDEA